MSGRRRSWMSSPAGLRGRRVVVMGLGIQGGGLGVAEFLREHGADLVVTDLRPPEALEASVSRLGGQGVRYVLGRHDIADFEQAEIVVRNPAVPLDAPQLAAARAAGATIEMEMTLFARWCRARQVVGITGTRGKTTTATALRDMVQSAGRPVVLAGNMRVSALAQLASIEPDHVVVLELSSWQVEGLALTGVHLHGAVITNLMPDHLDRYASLEAYAQAKAGLVAGQGPTDWAVLPANDRWGDWYAQRAGGRVLRYDRGRAPPGWERAKVAGRHNQANLAAATCAARELGVDLSEIARAVQSFGGVPERQEFIGRVHDVRVYNDTTATIPQATLAALDAIPGPWVLIAGGSDKRLNFEALASRLLADARLRGVVLLPGAGSDRLRPLIGELTPIEANDMTEAVARAFERAQPDDALLLSPACASFGQFANEFDRGAQFAAAVGRHGRAALG